MGGLEGLERVGGGGVLEGHESLDNSWLARRFVIQGVGSMRGGGRGGILGPPPL